MQRTFLRNQDEEYQFEKQLPAVLKSVQDVRVALGEDIISADIEIARAWYPFNSKLMMIRRGKADLSVAQRAWV
jgi:uncharacterized protein YecT (DUF1311 family)